MLQIYSLYQVFSKKRKHRYNLKDGHFIAKSENKKFNSSLKNKENVLINKYWGGNKC